MEIGADLSAASFYPRRPAPAFPASPEPGLTFSVLWGWRAQAVHPIWAGRLNLQHQVPRRGCRRPPSGRGRPLWGLRLQSCLGAPRRPAPSRLSLQLRFPFLLCIFLRSKGNHHPFCITVKAPQLLENPSEAFYPPPLSLRELPPSPVCSSESVDVYLFKCTAHTCTQPPGSWKRGALCKHVCREPGAGNPKVLGNFLHSLRAPISPSPGNRGPRTGETTVIPTGDFLPRVSDIHHPSLQINSVAPPCRRSNHSPPKPVFL